MKNLILYALTNYLTLKHSSYSTMGGDYVISSQSLFLLALFLHLSSGTRSGYLMEFFLTNRGVGGDQLVTLIFDTPLTNEKTRVNGLGTGFVSLTPFFDSCRWLEREGGEMLPVRIYLSNDTRNLLLPYGDRNFPLQKIFPSIGFRDYSFRSFSDLLSSDPITIQY